MDSNFGLGTHSVFGGGYQNSGEIESDVADLDEGYKAVGAEAHGTVDKVLAVVRDEIKTLQKALKPSFFSEERAEVTIQGRPMSGEKVKAKIAELKDLKSRLKLVKKDLPSVV